MSTIDVRLQPSWIETVGYRYDVILDGETIVRRSRDPEFDAARVLHARGIRGRFRTIDFVTGRPRMVHDIERAARLRTIERADTGPPTVGLFVPMSGEDRTRLRPHSLHQGRVFREGMATGTGKPRGRAGGEGRAVRAPVVFEEA